RYMAPEQIAGEPVTPRTDIYAIASLAVRLISGEVPITGSDEEIIKKKVRGDPVAIGGLPSQLANVVLAALSRDPSSRPENARAIAIALREAAGSKSSPAIREPALALAVQIGAMSALIKRLTGEIRSWAGVELDELRYQRARDQLLALDLPLSKAIAT